MRDAITKNVLIAYKNIGETPLECLERSRLAHHIAKSVPMTYAGRLDPMAEGVIIILLGDECKNKEQYLGLDKTYEFEVLVGFETDTNDLLGLITSPGKRFFEVLGSPLQSQIVEKAQPDQSKNLLPASVQKILESFIGTSIQKYPSFSSKTVNGKQLFQLALDGELPEEMPEHTITIYDLECTASKMIKKEELEKEIISRIDLVKGDFRQKEIIETWEDVLSKSSQKEFTILSFITNCSSGTYIRQLVADISDKLQRSFVTYSIKRTQVGDYKQEVK